MSSATDVIYWCPQGVRGTILRAPVLRHLCPTAVVVASTTREALDPMALGTCRYCREPLPVSPAKGSGT